MKVRILRVGFAKYFKISKMEKRKVAQSCLTLCDPMDCSLPGSSVHGIFQAIVPEWIAKSKVLFKQCLLPPGALSIYLETREKRVDPTVSRDPTLPLLHFSL